MFRLNIMGKPIFIIGGSHHNTLGVIRAFGELGLAKDIVLFIDNSDHIITTTKYVTNERIHRFSNNCEIAELVIEAASKYDSKPVVICCGDPYIEAIDNSSDIISTVCTIPRASHFGGIVEYLDKNRQRDLAIKCGFELPRKFEIDNVKFPCILKPENSTKGSKNDIAICRSEAELKDYLKNHNTTVSIEEFIEKEIEYQLIGCSLHQQIIIPGYTDIIRQPENTNTGYLKYSPISDGFVSPELLDKVKKLIIGIGYLGLFSVEFLRAKNGKDYFLEINMRNDGNAYCVTSAGVNLPYLWYKYADNPDSIITEQTDFSKPIYWLPEDDLRSIKKIGPYKWLKQWTSADSHAYANKKDPKPVVYYFLYFFKRHIFH